MKGPEMGPVGCDTVLSISNSGDSRRVVFGKNSDRPRQEAQPLAPYPGCHYPRGATVRCQYLSIPQVESTLAVLGSRPWWLWGFEHGVNAAGVAIGNEAIWTRDEVPDVGLLGMDLVRLGLERGKTAAAAKDVIISLVSRYGQGGAASYLGNFRYQSSFIIADPDEAYVVETSGTRWASKRVTESVAISNLLTIEDDFDEASTDIEQYARDRGWWDAPKGTPFNFRAAYEDASARGGAEPRYGANYRALAAGVPDVATMMSTLRGHSGGLATYEPVRSSPVRSWSVCLHPEEPDQMGTAASFVVDLTEPGALPVAWCSMGSPCLSPFVPIPFGTELPDQWIVGGQTPDDRSLWWQAHQLAAWVNASAGERAPALRDAWKPWESEMLATTAADPGSAARMLISRTARLVDLRAVPVDDLRS